MSFGPRTSVFVDFWRHCGGKAKKLADTLASSGYVNTPAIRLRSLTPKVPTVVCLPAFSTVKGVLLRFKQEDMKVATRRALMQRSVNFCGASRTTKIYIMTTSKSADV